MDSLLCSPFIFLSVICLLPYNVSDEAIPIVPMETPCASSWLTLSAVSVQTIAWCGSLTSTAVLDSSWLRMLQLLSYTEALMSPYEALMKPLWWALTLTSSLSVNITLCDGNVIWRKRALLNTETMSTANSIDIGKAYQYTWGSLLICQLLVGVAEVLSFSVRIVGR